MQASHILPLVLSRGLPTRFISDSIGGDDVVTDLATGLMWAVDGNEAGCANGGTKTWVAARDYARDLTFAGFTDWRLPNINELLSIVDYSKYNPPIFDPPFTNTALTYYKSSTTYKELTTINWSVMFENGKTVTDYKEADRNIRCVRGGL